MRDDINLAPKNRTQKKTRDVIFIVSLGLFLLVFAIGAMLLLYSLSLTSEQEKLGQTKSELENRLAGFAVSKQKILTVNERLNSIRKVISGRKKIDSNVLGIISYLPENLSIDNITADDKKISIGLSSSNLSDFDTLLETKIPELAKDKSIRFKNITMGSFSQKGSAYSISMDFSVLDTTK